VIGVLTEADVRAAQVLLDELAAVLPDSVGHLKPTAFLEARGVVAGHLADVRVAGYLEGVQRGRQEAAHVVLDALRGEGLAP
jgi:hypothetical protein